MKVMTVEVISKTVMKKNIQKPQKLPISILTIFFTLQFLIGYDFGCYGVLRRQIRHFFKYYCRVICFVAFIILGIPLIIQDSSKMVYATITMMQFLGHVMSLHIAKYKVFQFITDIRPVNSNIRSKENFGGVSACVYCVFICSIHLIIRLIVISISINDYGMIVNVPAHILYDVIVICIDLLHIIQILVNYYAYCAVIYFKHLVDNRKLVISDIRKHFMYIADCCDKIRPLYGNLYLVQLLACVPKLLIALLSSLMFAKLQKTGPLPWIQVIYATIVIIQLCSPATVAELVKKQMENVKLVLYTRLSDEKDMEKNLEIVNLLRYMTARPLYHNVCRMFPVDIKLLVVVFSFVSTYLIVIIQFTHIYD